MARKTLQISIEPELAALVDPSGESLDARVHEFIVLRLIEDEEISSGKGAELLGITKDAMRELMSKHGIPYFRLTPDELRAEVDAIDAILRDADR